MPVRAIAENPRSAGVFAYLEGDGSGQSLPTAQRIGDGIQIVFEEVGVDVEGHRRGRVTEHALDRLHVRSGRDREAGSRVLEVVRPHSREVRVLCHPPLS